MKYGCRIPYMTKKGSKIPLKAPSVALKAQNSKPQNVSCCLIASSQKPIKTLFLEVFSSLLGIKCKVRFSFYFLLRSLFYLPGISHVNNIKSRRITLLCVYKPISRQCLNLQIKTKDKREEWRKKHHCIAQSIYSKLSQGKSKSFADSALQYKKSVCNNL